MTSDVVDGLPGSSMFFWCWDLRDKVASITVFYGDGAKRTRIESNFTASHTYNDAGFYTIETIVKIGGLIEHQTYADYIFIDHIPNSLRIRLKDTLIYQPPGIVQVEVYVANGGNDTNYAECIVDYDDMQDRRPDFYTGALAAGERGFFKSRMFIESGFHTITANCTNRMGVTKTYADCQVKSECFSEEGIFEEHYASPVTPMIIITSMKVLITSRADITCKVSKINFLWDMWSLNQLTYERNTRIDIVQPELDTFTFERGVVDPGLYILTLNLTTRSKNTNVWLYGLTYIRIVGSPLIAKIKGGLIRATGKEIL